MRQPPGPRNALGQVKFMFPNKYNIYLHDTPAKSLFDRDVRAFSHGCIRLQRSVRLRLCAARGADRRSRGAVPVASAHRAANRGSTLDKPVPVHLIYRTAFTAAKGHMQYRDDIYGRDARIWAALRAVRGWLSPRGAS